ncbi:MAG: hypothetical protein ABI297_03265 [Ginsengibacter sp.]
MSNQKIVIRGYLFVYYSVKTFNPIEAPIIELILFHLNAFKNWNNYHIFSGIFEDQFSIINYSKCSK